MTLPSTVCDRLLAWAGIEELTYATKPRHRKKLRMLRNQMRQLSSDFARGIASESKYSNPYSLYNFPLNFAKTMRVIGEVSSRHPDFFLNRQRCSILDIGCGEGAGMYGAYYALRNIGSTFKIRLTGIDRSRIMIEHARQMFVHLRRSGEAMTVAFSNRDLTDMRSSMPRKKYDIIICSNSLAEIVEDESIPARNIGVLLGHLSEGGLLVIIEPALRSFSRRLMRLRDGLIGHKAAQVIMPCAHRGRCSLLQVDSRDEWCHESVPWKPPAFLRILNEGMDREIDILKYSYLVIARTREGVVWPGGYRIISNLLREKGKTRCYLCTENGRVELVRLNRFKSKENMLFDKMKKGDMIDLRNFTVRKSEYWEITTETRIQRV